MLVTDGEMVFNTNNMILIDEKIGCNIDRNSKTQILMSITMGEYYVFYQNGFGTSKFKKTNCDTFAEIDESDDDIILKSELQLKLDDEVMDMYDWEDMVAENSLIEMTLDYLDYKEDDIIESLQENYNLSPIEAKDKIIELSTALESNGVSAFKDINIGAYGLDGFETEIELLLRLENNVVKKTLVKIYDIYTKEMLVIKKIQGKKSYLITFCEKNSDVPVWCISEEFPEKLILLFQAYKSKFDLSQCVMYFSKKYLDISVTDFEIKTPAELEIAKIWGVSRQNLSTTYNNPKTKTRIRRRQKMIIELGTICLKYQIDKNDLLRLIKKQNH